jgi:DNA-binding SARP family transcriptional activator
MRWAILGPVEASVDGRAARIRRPQELGVVGYLLLNANQVVAAEQLVEGLWGGAPPAAARTQVQVCVSHIRRALREAGAEQALTSQAGGYRMVVASGELDLTEFTALVAKAPAVAADGQLDKAADLLRAGLSLWRGAALTGASGAFVTAAVANLQERRLAAYEELGEIMLATSQYGALIGELRPQVDAHPLRERLVGHLMLALAATGQQAEALRLYTATRARLVDELGVEPGAELAGTHLRVLRQEATIATTARSTRPASTPAQLPPAIVSFSGRTAAMRQLDAYLPDTEGGRVVVCSIAGSAGIGKTALAVQWAHQVADRFPDGQLFVNLRGFDPAGTSMSSDGALRGFLGALGVPAPAVPTTLDGQVGLFRSLLAGKRMLIVLDNARDTEQIRPLLPGAGGTLVLITSRTQLTSLVVSDSAHPLTLDLLSTSEARDLLIRRLGRDRVASEPHAVDDIIAGCAGLPLALAVVAARAATRAGYPLAVVARELRDAPGLEAFASRDSLTDVRSAFASSYRPLRPDTARMFRLLSLHPGPDIAVCAAASLTGAEMPRARSLLAELADAHLVSEQSVDRYACHDLLRTFAGELCHALDPETERHRAQGRVLAHYAHTAHAGALLLDPHRDPIPMVDLPAGVRPERLNSREHVLAWFTTERPVLLAAVEQAYRHGYDTHTWQLAWTLSAFFHRQGHWRDWTVTQHAALNAAQRELDLPAQAYSHRSLALAYTQLGRYDDAHAHFRRALVLAAELGDPIAQAHTHLNFAIVLDRQRRHRDALGHAQRALALFDAAAHSYGYARALNAVGWYHAQLGEYELTIDHCGRALAWHHDLGDLAGQAETCDSLGYAHDHLGDHGLALSCYQRGIDLYRQTGDQYGEANTLTNLGDTHRATGADRAAQEAWTRALTILDQLHHPRAAEIRAKLRQ